MRVAKFLLILIIPLFAIDFKINLSKNKVFVNEPISAIFTLTYNKEDRVKKINFDDIEIKDFFVKQINSFNLNNSGKIVKKYIFIIYPLKEGNFEIGKIAIKVLLEDKKSRIKEWKSFYTKDKNIQSIKAPLNIVGSLTLKSKIEQKNKILNYTIILKGLSNFEYIKPFKLNIDEYYYTTPPTIKYEYNKSKIEGVFIQHFSIISSKDIVIPPIKFSYFNSNIKMIENLESKKYSLKIKKDFNYFYLVFFFLGVIISSIFFFLFKKKPKGKNLKKSILFAKSKKELYTILVKYNHIYDFNKEIKKLEEYIYNKKSIKLSKLDILRKIK